MGVIFSVKVASWYNGSMIATRVRVVLVQQEYVAYTRSCSSALRAACSCVRVWFRGQNADDALPSLVARLLLLLCRPEGMLLYCGVGRSGNMLSES